MILQVRLSSESSGPMPLLDASFAPKWRSWGCDVVSQSGKLTSREREREREKEKLKLHVALTTAKQNASSLNLKLKHRRN